MDVVFAGPAPRKYFIYYDDYYEKKKEEDKEEEAEETLKKMFPRKEGIRKERAAASSQSRVPVRR